MVGLIRRGLDGVDHGLTWPERFSLWVFVLVAGGPIMNSVGGGGGRGILSKILR